MDLKSAIVHVVDGRIRVKVPSVKNAPAACRTLERRLCAAEGIDEVRANPTTGSLVIWYHPARTTPTSILQTLAGLGYLAAHAPAAPAKKGSPIGAKIAETLFASAAEVALRRLVGALT